MKAEEFYPEKSGSLDGLRHMRLMTLLRDMIDKDGWVKSSEILGVSYRTLVRARESGRLTGRLAHAMERHLLAGGGSEAARQREEMGLLKQKVETLERLVRETGGRFSGELEGLGAGIEALRKEHSGELRALGRRLAKVETGGGAREASIGIPLVGEGRAPTPPWRLYSDLVTPEPEPGEEVVYGDAAPLVVEWREAMKEVGGAKKGVPGIEARMRWLQSEIDLIGSHGMTLPPRSYPWDEFQRKREVRDRVRWLERARARRNRALLRRWIRRVLSLGLWRN